MMREQTRHSKVYGKAFSECTNVSVCSTNAILRFDSVDPLNIYAAAAVAVTIIFVVVRLMCVIVQYIIVSTLRSIQTRHK